MSELNSSSPVSNATKKTIIFMIVLSFICALILSVLASALKVPQEEARELDRSKQMLIAAQIVSPFGYFQVQNDKGDYVPAKLTEKGMLVPDESKIGATGDQILEVYRLRIQSFLINDQGKSSTFKEAGINEAKYVREYRKTGYYLEPFKLIYKIYPNPKSGQKEPDQNQVDGYVIPINGMGLWDAIYGYLAVKPDGDTVIGISWYDQKETPGLGANISEPPWQSQFPGKKIFQPSPSGQTDFKTAPIGITVVKGKVSEVYGDSPKAESAVDGMAGATLTGNGVTNAYKDVLSSYRPFLLDVHRQFEKAQPAKN